MISTESEIAEGIYKIEFSQSVPDIEVDDIIVGDQGLGFLRRVNSVSIQNNVAIMETTQATMEEVFGNININFTTDLSRFNKSSSVNSSSKLNYEWFAEGVSVSKKGETFRYNFNNVDLLDLSNIDFKITSGFVSYDAKQDFSLIFSGFSLEGI